MAEPKSERVLNLLGDDYARQILAYLTKEPMLVEELREQCDCSESTIYDRLDQLHSMGLVSEDLQIDPQGHHRKQYETILNSINVTFHDGIYEVQLEIKEDPLDRFARMWNGMRRN
ncbi:helix-turn-helix domain-containing protein [Natronolimnohabitans sp. A-GB9]|uniref:winged helix-turn-helix domain-containing protein n=1 Tax=Natronolimnohabitans sp. A-GB9 TaxID=3069757 RepID=UPI0027AEB375|nr:helix-turn-helix domain-containing protein [Natronolimnohabitans sp. A-GB9]MDQ2051715.1 helix-turn-helix domain-containing protein [Natronolimnohabitans sp. A-GB9]